MKKSTFTTKKLSMLLAIAVAGQLLISLPAQASTSTSGGIGNLFQSPEWLALVQWLKDCFGDERAKEEIKAIKADICQGNQCQEVPEPLTILGVGATLAALPAFKKRYAELKKEQ